ncbi:WD repeat-containing protein 78 [Caerostris darwini]|uniref:Dynein axonemal intermediate chain 4 n=1 Tax=Caerostris darwini TaxID=1538125 RepID=A0AAV4WSM1_9ARAC|nr:WD repeat-containing protein 78 [Caerostris darwini]
MLIKELILDWLEEGFSHIHEKKVSHESVLIPSLKNEIGEIVTPKPLFFTFLDDIELEPNFLVEYLEVIENMLRQGKDTSKGVSDSKGSKRNRVIFSVFELPDCLVSKTSPHYEKILLKNDQYKKAVDLRTEYPVMFQDQNIQEGFSKFDVRGTETIPIILDDKTTLVNSYKMKEHYDENEIVLKSPPKTFAEYIRGRAKFRNYKEFLGKIPEYPSILSRVKNSLYVMEKTLNYNTYKNTLLSYNNCTTDLKELIQPSSNNELETDSLKETKSSEEFTEEQNTINLKHHLQFYLPSLKDDYSATCIECNPKNPSIFISGYGVPLEKEIDTSPRGIVLCWNIHKCEHPERIYHTEEAIECIEFSKFRPYMIVVGMRYGFITVFDLRKSELRSKINNRLSSVRPVGAITSVRWIRKKYSLGKESELILAVSMDGLLTSYSLGTTLTGNILRTVKRGIDLSKEQRNLILATDAAGMCLQVNPDNTNVFIVGTIEGQALQCEFNDPEDYIQVYDCHYGPTYDIQWSPIVNDVFMTCGADRRVILRDSQKTKTSKTVFVRDIALKLALSNMKSSLFVVLTKKVIYIFDLAVHLHRSLAELQAKEDDFFTSVVFCSKNDWILVGRSNGIIDLYELTGLTELPGDQSKFLKETLLPEQ